MLRTVHFDNRLCRNTVEIHDKSAKNPLFVNLHRIFAEKQIPGLAFMGSHFPAKPPGVFRLAVIFWYGHSLPSQSASPPALPKGEPSAALNALHQTVYRNAPLLLANWNWQYVGSMYNCTHFVAFLINCFQSNTMRANSWFYRNAIPFIVMQLYIIWCN